MVVVLGLIAVLAKVALPSYSDYVRRGRLVSAFDGLGSYRLQLEQFYQDGGNYSVTNCGVTAPAATAYFQLSCTLTSSGQGFTASATGLNTMVGYVYSVDASNNFTTSKYAGVAISPAATCWWQRAGDC